MACVSIVMPIFNSVDYVKDAIDSVIAQTFSEWQLIVVDDCSTDGSLELVKKLYRNEKRIVLLRLAVNSGPAIARNLGIREAAGRYIAFLDADDLWLPNKLEKQISFMRESGVPFSFSGYEKIDSDGVSIGEIGVPQKVNYKTLLKTCVIGCLTVVYDSYMLGKVEMPVIDKRQDFGLWLRLLKETEYAYGISEPLAKYRVHDNSISYNKRRAAFYTWRLYRRVEKLPFLQACYYFSHYAVRGVLRRHCPDFARNIGILH
ncbi:Glycosyltransferase involved in cell wall bisynthesis [Modicisalibacter ilicicola DSM 19980]|uniref:Glycosyltransferase involved in cell wall bisynthesis n=1 Tax=Modicisalibacter ilicicola DSM 19980 TaxID=1121942 RepID=A0A1M5ENF7_9GAMM|nr:glycosyltransferase family 2 protein [Halomonas ilicicola]SHF80716.1 Glycosyltransferase involved in cell wall bisynthesis [Halomonas ilicicola DSM 19980]